MNKNIAIIGASKKEDRYAYKAQKMLIDHGYQTFPINPFGGEALNTKFYKSLSEIKEQIHTITLYVRPSRLEQYMKEIITKKPKRVIFNPGTESKQLQQELEKNNIEAIEGCTLVMLTTNQF